MCYVVFCMDPLSALLHHTSSLGNLYGLQRPEVVVSLRLGKMS
jgi:hypothetical protein